MQKELKNATFVAGMTRINKATLYIHIPGTGRGGGGGEVCTGNHFKTILWLNFSSSKDSVYLNV